jgi:flagellar basal-body rod modification protein FlgD
MTSPQGIYANLGLTPRRDNTGPASGKLGQQDFLKLMIAQFRNQDPTAPMKNGQFLGQLAQFGTVSGIQKLQKSFSGLANFMQSDEALRAAGLVGHRVLVKNDSAMLGAKGGIDGAIDVPAGGGHIKLTVTDAAGHTVRDIDLGDQSSGLVDFSWDGRTADGDAADPGVYHVSAELVDGDGGHALPTLMDGEVTSVSLAHGAIQLAVAGLGDVSLSDVREIQG